MDMGLPTATMEDFSRAGDLFCGSESHLINAYYRHVKLNQNVQTLLGSPAFFFASYYLGLDTEPLFFPDKYFDCSLVLNPRGMINGRIVFDQSWPAPNSTR